MSKRFHFPQGSDEWLAARLGIPTASNFHKIVTPGGKLSTQARAYAIYLVTEKLLNRSLDPIQSTEWMERGKELEPEAVQAYEFQNEVETETIGFITTDDGRMGCSPDRLLKGVNGGMEIKCPAPHTHVGYMVDGPGTDYRCQIQGQLLIGEFAYVDFWSYHPEMPPVHVRTYRDEAYLKILKPALDQFCDDLDALAEKVRAMGAFQERAKILTPRAELVVEQERLEPFHAAQFAVIDSDGEVREFAAPQDAAKHLCTLLSGATKAGNVAFFEGVWSSNELTREQLMDFPDVVGPLTEFYLKCKNKLQPSDGLDLPAFLDRRGELGGK